jgi:DegV family protein with EDD domain
MSIRIVIDSTSDVTQEIIDEYNLKMIPLTVNFEDGSYLDKVELNTEAFFDKLGKTDKLPTTSQVSPGVFIETFSEILLRGDEVLGIFLASEFSGTYESARIARDMIGSDRIHLIDSRSACLGTFSLIIEAAELVNKGTDVHEVVEKIEALKDKTVVAAGLDTLKYLEKGGRLSKGQAIIGSILNIKPIITIKNGQIKVIDKVRGKNKTIKWFDDWIEENKFDLTNKTVLLFHAQNFEQLKILRKMIEEKYKIKNIIEAEIGSVIGTHTGPGLLALAFLNK